MVNLLSPNDLEQLRRAMASGQDISLTRTLGALTVTASTTRAVPDSKCDMPVRLDPHMVMCTAHSIFGEWRR